MIAIGANVAFVAAVPSCWVGSCDSDWSCRVNSRRVVAVRAVRRVVVILLGFSVSVCVVGGDAGIAVDVLAVFWDAGTGFEV